MRINSFIDLGVGFVNGLVNSVQNPRQKLPVVIQFPINDICNSKCQMCNIWKQKLDYEISPEQVSTILQDKLFKKVVSVGINGGEPTLRKDIAAVVESIIKALPKLKSISLITNAYKENAVCQAIDGLAEVCSKHDVSFGVMVSLDGYKGVHDKVRGRKGNFDSAVKVLNYLKNHSGVSNFKIGCTVIKENVFDVENLLSWCIKNDIYGRFRLGIPHKRLYSNGIEEPFGLTYEERFHFANFLDHLYKFYEKDESRRFFYRSLRDQIIYDRKRVAGCDWKSQGVTITSRGELAYCAVESKNLGSLIKGGTSANELFWGNSDHLAEINNSKCDSCLHDYEGFSNRTVFVKDFLKRIINKLPTTFGKLFITGVKIIKSTKHWLYAKRELIKVIKPISKTSIRSNRVLICGWYGTETLGDKAILAGLMNALNESDDSVKIDVASLEPYVTKLTKIQLNEQINEVLSINEASNKLKGGVYSTIVLGGGPLMSSIDEVLKMLHLFSIASRIGVKTVIGGCGVGPLFKSVNTNLIGKLLRISNTIILRDQASKRLAMSQFKIEESQLHASIDPAFKWVINSTRKRKREKKIVLALRDWPINEYVDPKERSSHIQLVKKFENELKNFVSYVLNNSEFEIVPFCMHKLSTGGDDRYFYQRLFADFPQILKNLDIPQRAPIEDIQVFERAHFVLAMRFHSAVFSIGTNTPFLCLDYTEGGKIKGLLETLDLQDHMLKMLEFDGMVTAKRVLSNNPIFDSKTNLIKANLKQYEDIVIQ